MEVTKSEADNKISLQTSLLNWIEEQIRLRLMFLPVSMDKSPDIQRLNFKLQSNGNALIVSLIIFLILKHN